MAFSKDEADKVDILLLITKFGTYCKPKQNIAMEKHHFNTRAQESGETIDQYVTELKLIVKNHGYHELESQLLNIMWSKI